MKIAGLITEYNPFHNGHKYHIDETRRITGADYIVVIMSGNFVQRGAPAITDKYVRCEMALSCGADLIIELPLSYSISSAEFFALGAVKTLTELGCVDYLCFGSELGRIDILSEIAGIFINEPEDYKQILSDYIKQGFSYPLSRTKAISDYTGNTQYSDILSSPNNILAIEYLKALKKIKSNIEPVTIKRLISDYHETDLKNEISSATSIRELIYRDTSNSPKLYPYMPLSAADLLEPLYKKSFPVVENDFSQILYYKLSYENPSSINDYLDSSNELSMRIYNRFSNYYNLNDFIKDLKTKDITYTRISRFLFHIILNMKKSNFNLFINDNIVYYARILGFNSISGSLMNTLKCCSNIPLITKLANAKKLISINGYKMLEEDINAAHIYNRIIFDKYNLKMPNEFVHPLIIKPF